MRSVLAGILMVGLLVFSMTVSYAHAQEDPIAGWLAQMTPQEKVGQLFVVAFWGRNPSPPSRAGILIQQYKIGGVVLITSNHNLVNSGSSTPQDVARLSNTLQTMALDEAGPGIPLFIAIDHEGDGFPYTRITNGTTPLPNSTAIGATWNTTYAEQVGAIAGRELAAMGINVLLGPVIDVLDDPRPGGKGDAGTRVFGGDPYWVGELGRAYIRGVHIGSEGRVLTVAKHFPGHGGSDRLPDDEVATVDKSLQELERVELAPFFAVTQTRQPEGLDRTDAMMTSHIRYRGFYGDIRQFTRPITFDAEGMQALLSLSQFREWRKDGILVSDSLGVPAVRKYFDPQLRSFPHRQVAREAFLAGNDLLILSQFALSHDWAQQYDNTVEVLEYFAEAYESDTAFAARVDDAVTRILRLKFRLYPVSGDRVIAPERVLVAPEGLADLGQGTAVVSEIARRAATVLLPTEDSLPPPPRRDEDILILAEERLIRECYETTPECQPKPLLPTTAIQEATLRLYGPAGTGQVAPEHVHTRTYAQLKALLTLPLDGQNLDKERTPSMQDTGDVGALLEEAEWIVFAMLDPSPRHPDSDALQLFLARNLHLVYSANVVVLAYTAPYYLDATEISKLTAYYVFYGKTQPFIDVSVRTLFGEVRPQGKPPVSIEGTYYDLGTRLSPDPAQQIALHRIEPTEAQGFVPITLRVRTSIIRDHNGNPVPDGTQVRFVARDREAEQMVDASMEHTANGIAQAELSIKQPGRVSVAASSGETGEGRPLTFQALLEPTATPTTKVLKTPTLMPTPTPTRANTPTVVPTPAPTRSPTAAPSPTAVPPSSALAALLDSWSGRPRDLPGVLVACLVATGAGYAWWGWKMGLAGRVRLALVAWIGALGGYLAYGWGWIPIGEWVNWPAWISAGAPPIGGAILVVVTSGIAQYVGKSRHT